MAKPTKRSILEPLTKKRLVEIGRKLELDIAARTAKSGFVDTLARSRQVDLEDVLPHLKRDELKAACEDHGLDSSGRSKDPLIQRLLGGSSPASKPPGKKAKPRKKKAGKKNAAAGGDTDESAPTGLKARLRRFALWVPGGYRGNDAGVDFVRDLLGCFEWEDDYEGSLESPSAIKIAAAPHSAQHPPDAAPH